MPLTGTDFAQYAASLGTGGSLPGHFTNPVYAAVSALDPLPAVIQCASAAQAISPQWASYLSTNVNQNSFADFVGPDDEDIADASDMRQKVPPGAFIAFIFVEPPPPGQSARQGRRHLAHAMVSLGNGWAAGTRARNLGLPAITQNWDLVNLADCLLWDRVPGSYDSIAESLGIGSPRHLRIRYRKIELFQGNPPSSGATTAPPNQGLVPPADLQNYTPIPGGWYFYAPRLATGMRDEGWKFHVSCNAANAVQILALVLPILRQGNFAHKFVPSLKAVAEDETDEQRRGKVIAIYPDDIRQAFTILGLIDTTLSGHVNRAGSPVIANEIAVGNTVVYTRYGAYSSSIFCPNTGEYVDDPIGRTRPYWILNPWGVYPNQANLSWFPSWPTHDKTGWRRTGRKLA